MLDPGTAKRWQAAMARAKVWPGERDLVLASGRESFRTGAGYIQLFCKPEVDQGDAEHCLQRDAYHLWNCRTVK